jgi:hypothetical protein
MIIMFNLLIAIISETFSNVNQNSVEAGFQERASLIAENQAFVFRCFIKKRDRKIKNSYLYFATNLDKEISIEEQEATTKISKMGKDIRKKVKYLGNNMETIINNQQDQKQMFKDSIDEMKKTEISSDNLMNKVFEEGMGALKAKRSSMKE